MKEGIVLFAHGSRDPAWARPFEKIASDLSRKLSQVEIRLAYLEIMRPSLDEALADLVARKVESIRVVPLFLGFGGHVKEDLPRLIAAANLPVKVAIDPPVGEQPALIEAIVRLITSTKSP